VDEEHDEEKRSMKRRRSRSRSRRRKRKEKRERRRRKECGAVERTQHRRRDFSCRNCSAPWASASSPVT
jgi:hypothetical protein